MTVSEALTALEIDASEMLSPDDLRRRYLRGVRRHRPESDPQGFQRVRDAYELLRALPRFAGTESPAPLGDSSSAEPAPVPLTVSLLLPRPPAQTAKPAGPEKTEKTDQRNQAAPAQPVVPMQHPAAAQPMDWERLRQALADSALPGAPPPPIAEAIDHLLGLLASRLAQGPAILAGDIRHCLAARGDEQSLLSGGLAVRWLLARELLAAAPDLPPDFVSAIARAIQAGDLRRALPSLEVYVSVMPGLGPKVAALLERKAPALAESLAPILQPPPEPVRGTPAFPVWRFVLIVLVLCGGVTRTCTSSRQPDDAPRPPPAGSALEREMQQARTQGRERDAAVADLAREVFARADAEGVKEVSSLAHQLADQAATHRCDTALMLQENLTRAVGQLAPAAQSRYQADCTLLAERLTAACTSLRMRADDQEKWRTP